MASQCFHKKAMKTTINKVLNVLFRVFIRGTTQLATVETKTRRTAMTASKMLMNFPSRFLAVAFSSPSNCTTCCCCCCSSILEIRVWHASSASCGQEHILGHSSSQLLSHQARTTIPACHPAHAPSSCPAVGAEEAVPFAISEVRSPLLTRHCSLQHSMAPHPHPEGLTWRCWPGKPHCFCPKEGATQPPGHFSFDSKRPLRGQRSCA